MKNELAVQDWSWEITKRCNLNCLHCISGKEHCDRELTTEESLKAISCIARLGGKNLRLTGGEPLMRKDLGLIIKEANSLNLDVDLITNGTMLNDGFLKKHGSFIRHMAISIDGQKEVHDRLRGNGSYKKAMTAVKRVLDLGINLSVYITVHSLNENSLDLLIDGLISMGVSNFHLNEINMEGNASQNLFLRPQQTDTQKRKNRIISQLRKSIVIKCVDCDERCSVSPGSVYLRCDGRVYACAEIALNSRNQSIDPADGSSCA